MKLIGVDHFDPEMQQRINSALEEGPVLVEGVDPQDEMEFLAEEGLISDYGFDTDIGKGYGADLSGGFYSEESYGSPEEVEEEEVEAENSSFEAPAENEAVANAVPEGQVVFLDEDNPYHSDVLQSVAGEMSPENFRGALASLRPENEMNSEEAYHLLNSSVRGTGRLYDLFEGRPEEEPAEAVADFFTDILEDREEIEEEDVEELREATQEIEQHYPTWEAYREKLLEEGPRSSENQAREKYWKETVDAAVEAHGEDLTVVRGATHAMPVEGNLYDKLDSDYDVEAVSLREAAS
ncbi:MAG: hypothetical protein ABEK04_01950 [Candidatus Nanohalobium sp.]